MDVTHVGELRLGKVHRENTQCVQKVLKWMWRQAGLNINYFAVFNIVLFHNFSLKMTVI